jgi:hypothetical protein
LTIIHPPGKTSIEDWQRAGLHHNYRAIIELLAAFYELYATHATSLLLLLASSPLSHTSLQQQETVPFAHDRGLA